MDAKILPVIIAGGAGSRLWPVSRQAHPKPFLKLQDGESLLQKTYQRAVAATQVDEVLVARLFNDLVRLYQSVV